MKQTFYHFMGNISTFFTLIAATHLKKVRAGDVYNCVASSLFLCKHLGSEQISCWSFGRGILSHSCLMHYSSCSILMGLDCRQTISAPRLQPCHCDGCSMWFSIILLKYARPSLKEAMKETMRTYVALKPPHTLQH